MKKVLISVEGQTEETFVGEVLQPHFHLQLILQPVVLKTRRAPGFPANKGGNIPYARIKKELLGLLSDTSAIGVTTMYDFYALPRDFPGYNDLPQEGSTQKVTHLEARLASDVQQRHFHPYLQIHEFEALLFTAPEQIVVWLNGTEKQQLALNRIRQAFPNPEEIDDDPHTSPANRIRSLFPGYQKEIAGALIAMDIGLDKMRMTCPHFAAWVTWLESLA